MIASPRIPPRALAEKRKEYSVSGRPRSLDRKGMIGPILPVRLPMLNRMKQYIAR